METIESIITLINVFSGRLVDSKTHIFSTNVFIPQNIINVDIKTYNYFSGFIKLVETFAKRTDGNWGLYIYVDDMLTNELNYDNAKFNYNNKPSNTFYNKIVKKTMKNKILKEHLQLLLNKYREYIKYIKEHQEEYQLIKIISYKCNLLARNDIYLGHPSTFGSIIRFIPLFDSKFNAVVCINISHAISVVFFNYILDWITSDDIVMIPKFNYNYDFSSNKKFIFKLYESELKYARDKSYKLISPNFLLKRIPAGLFGYKSNIGSENLIYIQQYIIYIKQLISIFNEYCFQIEINNEKTINKNGMEKYKYIPDPFSYGIDEIILSQIFIKITQLIKKTNTKNILFSKLNIHIDDIYNKYIKYALFRHFQRYFPVSILFNTENITNDFTNNFLTLFNLIKNISFETLLHSLDENKPLLLYNDITKYKKCSEYISIEYIGGISLYEIISYYRSLDINLTYINLINNIKYTYSTTHWHPLTKTMFDNINLYIIPNIIPSNIHNIIPPNIHNIIPNIIPPNAITPPLERKQFPQSLIFQKGGKNKQFKIYKIKKNTRKLHN